MGTEEDIQFSWYVNVFRKNIKTILLLTLIIPVVALAITLFMPNRYRSKAVIFVVEEGQMGLSIQNLGEKENGDDFTADYAREYAVAVLRSRQLAERLAVRLGLASDEDMEPPGSKKLQSAVRTVQESLSVSNRGSGLVDIFAIAESPDLSMRMANEAIAALDDVRTAHAFRDADFIKSQISETQQKLLEAQDRLIKFMRQNKTVQIEQEIRETIMELADMERQLVIKSSELDSTNKLLKNPGSENYRATLIRQQIAVKSEIEGLHNRIGILSGKLNDAPETAKKLLELTKEEYRYDGLLKAFEELYELNRVAAAKKMLGIRIIDYAGPSNVPFSPNRKRAIFVGLTLGGLFALFFVYTRELLRSSSQSTADETV